MIYFILTYLIIGCATGIFSILTNIKYYNRYNPIDTKRRMNVGYSCHMKPINIHEIKSIMSTRVDTNHHS
jgi:hypothetical protein